MTAGFVVLGEQLQFTVDPLLARGVGAVPAPHGCTPDTLDQWWWDREAQALRRDDAARLAAARKDAIAAIKAQASAAIAALAWRIERAEERDRLGLPGETVPEVLIEREAIRRASNRCEAEVNAAQDVAAVQAVAFAVTEADRPTPARITRLQFLSRFTEAEMTAILAAADQSPALKAALLKWQTAEGIVLTDAQTIAGVQALAIAGFIDAGRVGEILRIDTSAA